MRPRDLELALREVPVIGILRNYRVSEAIGEIERLIDGGVSVIEATIEHPNAVPTLAAAVQVCRERGVMIGAGTVNTVEQLEAAMKCGVDFVVSPGFSLAVAEAAEKHALLYIPGVATGTEVATALHSGLRILKAFPASHLTPAWVAAMRGPFPEAQFIATGGLTPDDIDEWHGAGCLGIGVNAKSIPAQWTTSSIERETLR